jgi:pimeloyl-ACP methyl ester carboxylesterase
MAVALVVGLAVGMITGSRWSLLIAPAAFFTAFELGRLGVTGPTVDRIHLGSTYGLLAFILGRLIPYLLVLLPMVVGVAYGFWLANRLGNRAAPNMGPASWVLLAAGSLAVVGLVLLLARPASTAPVPGPDGEPFPDSVAELIAVPIGGQRQAMMIRGRDIGDPVLLYLSGGPGGTDLGAMRADVGLEQHFVVVTWEQRGSGKSYSALDPVETLTLEQMVSDTIEVTNYLRHRFGQEKIYLAGNSWGTLLGVLAVQRRPDLYHAYVGTGQMVSPRETDVMFYEDSLAWARGTGNDQLAARLVQNGPPPYSDLLDYEPALSYEHAWNAYPELDTSKEMPANLFVPENSLMDRINGLRAFLDTFSILYPQLQDLDLRRDAPKLAVPVYIVSGAHEARGRAILAKEWFDLLEAPSKEMVVFEHSGHRPLFEEPALFASVMRQVLDASSAPNAQTSGPAFVGAPDRTESSAGPMAPRQ